jgi:UDP-N-acetyl-2-amino-2-deoxyglucuronate dehydrogenase
MKFLLVGNGFISSKHKEAIKMVGGEIIDVVEEKNDWRKAIKNTDADCVVILTPNDLHFEMAKAAAEAGKIVLCEKPLTIKSEDAKELEKYKNIFVVLQLRRHPLIEQIKKEIENRKDNKIKIDICFKRDDYYARSWKGDKNRSGGFLFNVGIHYFDLLIYLFGEPKSILVEKIDEKIVNGLTKAEANGILNGDNYYCKWSMHINKEESGKIISKREFIINGKGYNFSSKDNLSEENLHHFVYQDLLNKKGVRPEEALKSIKLLEKIYE